MKNSYYKKALMLGLGLTLFSQSCTDLSEDLYNDLAASSFYRNENEFIAALGDAYSKFGGIGNHSGLWTIQELTSDELVITTKGGDWYDGGQLLQLHKHEVTVDHPFINGTWNFLYGGVNACNRLIYQFDQLSKADASKTALANGFINELRGVRALWYYWLLDTYGNVPLITSFTDTTAPTNATRAQIYAFVETELKAVLPNLPTAVDASTYGRMTRWVAQSVLAKMYLNAGVYTGTTKYAESAAAAADIIDNAPFSLEGIYSANFSVTNGGSAENIFVYPYDKVFAGGFNWNMMTLHYASQGVFKLTAQPWNGYSVVEEFYNSYIDPAQNPGPQGPVWKGLTKDVNNDKVSDDVGTIDARLTNFLVGPQYNPDGSRAVDPGADASDPDGQPLTFTPFINQIYPNGWRQGGARIGKYQYEVGGTENMSNDFVIFRLADILLTRAEALARSTNNWNNAEALALVNQIRNRAKVTPFVTMTADEFYAERGREMFAEMTRRQDMIRFGKFNNAYWEKPASQPFNNLFPIPKAQRDVNTKLNQNPGYPQ